MTINTNTSYPVSSFRKEKEELEAWYSIEDSLRSLPPNEREMAMTHIKACLDDIKENVSMLLHKNNIERIKMERMIDLLVSDTKIILSGIIKDTRNNVTGR